MERSTKSINALVYLLAVVALVAGYLVVSGLLKRNYQSILSIQLEDHQATAHTTISKWVESRKREITAEAKLPLLFKSAHALIDLGHDRQSLISHPTQSEMRSHFAPYMTSNHIKGYSIIALNGTTLASSSTEAIGLPNILSSQPELFANVLQGETVISRLQRSAVPMTLPANLVNNITNFAAAPIFDPRGNIIAIFALRLAPKEDLFEQAHFRETRSGMLTYAFNFDGAVLTNIDEIQRRRDAGTLRPFDDLILMEPQSGTAHSEFILPVRMVLQGSTGQSTTGYINASGQSSIGAWSIVEELGIGIAVEMSRDRAYEMSRFFETLTIVAFSIGLLVATVVFLIMLEVGHKVDLHRKKLMATLSATRDVNFQIDSSGTISSVNKALDKVFGVDHELAVGKNVSSFLELGPEGVTSISHGTLLALSQKNSTEMIRATGIRNDGSPFPIAIQVEPMETGNHLESQQYLLVVHDYSEIERRETELRTALKNAEAGQRTKTSFLSTISHELRSPLISVIAALELLVERTKSNDDRNLLDSSQRSAQMLLGIIDDILDYSRMESDSLALTNQDVVLENVLSDVTDILRWQAWNNQVSLVPFCAPNLPMVKADGLRLRQILMNLVSNAIKFSSQMRQHGEVQVSISGRMSKKGSLYVVLTVRDNGIGMAQQTMDQIFQPFTQADSTIRRQYGGTGLGLSITDRLIKMMDGHISVSSDLGEGTLFSVEIPLETSDAVNAEAPAAQSLEDLKVLYVGADAETQKVVQAYVEYAGAQLQTLPVPGQGTVTPESDLVVVQGDTASITEELAAKFDCPVLEITNYGREVDPAEAKNTRIAVTSLVPSVFLPALTSLKTGDKVPAAPSLKMLPQSKVLLVEDDQMTREITLRMLKQLGIAADAVVNGEEGLSLWRSGQYTLLLSDCHMPIMDGFQMAASIRGEEEKRHLPKTPIIAVSADLTMEIQRLCEDCEINEYVPKPLTPAKLKVILNTYISNGKTHLDS
ncbi:MAG: response regulator [Thalassovita sp.]